MSIKIGNYEFEGPWELSQKDFLDRAGIYAILCYRLQAERPTVVYIGQSGEMGTRLANHERAACWRRNCSGALYVAVLWTPSSTWTASQRRAVERRLIAQYNPVCNRT